MYQKIVSTETMLKIECARVLHDIQTIETLLGELAIDAPELTYIKGYLKGLQQRVHMLKREETSIPVRYQ